ncbi:unnamed protein product, partial [Tenebrio molitor]
RYWLIFEAKKPMKDDKLWLIRVLAIDIVQWKSVKILFISTLVFHLVILMIQICFHFWVLDFDDFIKFAPILFSMSYVNVRADYKHPFN